MNIFLLKNQIRNLLICAALASTLIPLHAAEPKETAVQINQFDNLTQRLLSLEQFKPYIQQVQAEYGFKDEQRYLKDALLVDDTEKAHTKLKTKCHEIFKTAGLKANVIHLEYLFNCTNFVGTYCLIRGHAQAILKKIRLDALAPYSELMRSRDTAVNVDKLKPESLKLYHYHQNTFSQIASNSFSGDGKTLTTAMKDIRASDDPELKKWLHIPYMPLYTSLPEIIETLSKKIIEYDNDLTMNIESTFNFYERYQGLLKRIPFAEIFRLLKNHAQPIQKPLLHQKKSHTHTPTADQDGLIKRIVRFLLLTESYDKLCRIAYTQMEETYKEITSSSNNGLSLLDDADRASIKEAFEIAKAFYESLPTWTDESWSLMGLLEDHKIFLDEEEAARKAQLPNTTISKSSKNIITKAAQKHSHKKKFKKKKHKTETASPSPLVLEQQSEAPKLHPFVAKNTKMKIASDGSYYMTSDDHHDQITVHSLDDTIQATLWKKKNVSTYDIGTIRYSDYVLQWLNNPKQASTHKTFTDEQDKAYSIAIHTFPRLVDQYIEQLGSTTILTSRTSDQNEVRAVWIPGTYTIAGTTHYGLFVYLFDQNNICFHRMFEKRTHHELFQDIQQTNALAGYVVPNK